MSAGTRDHHLPGGVGTAEELLYLLGILMHPENKDQVLPLVLTGPKESADYFRVLNDFVINTRAKKPPAIIKSLLMIRWKLPA